MTHTKSEALTASPPGTPQGGVVTLRPTAAPAEAGQQNYGTFVTPAVTTNSVAQSITGGNGMGTPGLGRTPELSFSPRKKGVGEPAVARQTGHGCQSSLAGRVGMAGGVQAEFIRGVGAVVWRILFFLRHKDYESRKLLFPLGLSPLGQLRIPFA